MCQKLKSKIGIKDCCVFTTTSPRDPKHRVPVGQRAALLQDDGGVYITEASDTVTVGGQRCSEVRFQCTDAGVDIFNRI